MKPLIQIGLACALLVNLPALAQEANGCPEGSYSIVVSPDGTTLSILFDQFTLSSRDRLVSWTQRKVCRISAPLNLPANYAVGLYKADYRGFTRLFLKQEAELDVRYSFGSRDVQHGRVFKRKIKGPREGDFLFTESIGTGQMWTAGCGAGAVLNLDITLGLDGDLRTGDAMASLDSTDVAPDSAPQSAPQSALIYHLKLTKCP